MEKLRKTNVKHLKVVYSPEEPLESIEQQDISCRYHCICPAKDMRTCTERHTIPSSNAWVPAAAGLICGGEVVKDLVNTAHTMRIDLDRDPDNKYAKAAAEKADARMKESRKSALARMHECEVSKNSSTTEGQEAFEKENTHKALKTSIADE